MITLENADFVDFDQVEEAVQHYCASEDKQQLIDSLTLERIDEVLEMIAYLIVFIETRNVQGKDTLFDEDCVRDLALRALARQ